MKVDAHRKLNTGDDTDYVLQADRSSVGRTGLSRRLRDLIETDADTVKESLGRALLRDVESAPFPDSR